MKHFISLISPPVLLPLFLLIFGIFNIILRLLKYSFIPFNDYIINIASFTLIFWLTIRILFKNYDETKATTILSTFLPLIMIFYFVTKEVTINLNGKNSIIFVIFNILTFICSVVIFYTATHERIIKIGLGITYIILIISVSLMTLFLFAFDDFGKNTVIKFEMSPSSIYLAEIIDNDQGALGGSTIVKVTPKNNNLNIIIGKLVKDSKVVYSDKWGEFNEITLRWETDEILYINEKIYKIE